MEIKNNVTIGDVTMMLTFDFETMKCVKVKLVLPQHMDGQDLMMWKKRNAKAISIAKNSPRLMYYHALTRTKDGMDYLNIGLNSTSEDELRDELIKAILMTNVEWTKKAIAKVKSSSLDELCVKYGYYTSAALVPFVMEEESYA